MTQKSNIVIFHTNLNIMDDFFVTELSKIIIFCCENYKANIKNTNGTNIIYFCVPRSIMLNDYYQKKVRFSIGKYISNYKNNFKNDNYKIVFCTSKNLLNRMIYFISNMTFNDNKKNIYFCSTIILSDFHTREKEKDLCLCLWTMMFHKWKENSVYSRSPTLILTTMDIEFSIVNILPIAPLVFKYNHQQHPIVILFDNESGEYHHKSIKRYIRAAEIAYFYYLNEHRGIYLIFVPGKYESKLIKNFLREKIKDSTEILEVCDTASKKMEINVEHPRSSSKNKVIIVISNQFPPLFETNGITLIIDTLVKYEFYHDKNGNIYANYRWLSKSESRQRINKIGKNCTGIYIALQSEEKYLKLSDFEIPELLRISIDRDILKFIKFGLYPIPVMTNLITKLQMEEYIKLYKRLYLINSSGFLTTIGLFCYRFPLEIRKAAMVYHLLELNFSIQDMFLYLAVICTLDCYGDGIFIFPNRCNNIEKILYSIYHDSIMQKIEDKFGGYSDVDTILNVWIEICSNINPFNLFDLKCFCNNNGFIFKKFKEVIYLLKKCFLICNKMGIKFYYDHGKFSKPDIKEFGKTFYYLSSLTHQDYKTIIYYDSNGKLITICNGHYYKIDNRSIHKMILGNDKHKIYYSLVCTQKNTKEGDINIINVLHAIPEENDYWNTSDIFSSDTDSEFN